MICHVLYIYFTFRLTNLVKLDFVSLDTYVSGNNYLSWSLDVILHLSPSSLKDTIDLENNLSPFGIFSRIDLITRNLFTYHLPVLTSWFEVNGDFGSHYSIFTSQNHSFTYWQIIQNPKRSYEHLHKQTTHISTSVTKSLPSTIAMRLSKGADKSNPCFEMPKCLKIYSIIQNKFEEIPVANNILSLCSFHHIWNVPSCIMKSIQSCT